MSRLFLASLLFICSPAEMDAKEDLRLMSACNHNIIANSSMSWWGAWLNPDKGKQVIGPKRWYPEKKFDALEIIPDDWIKV